MSSTPANKPSPEAINLMTQYRAIWIAERCVELEADNAALKESAYLADVAYQSLKEHHEFHFGKLQQQVVGLREALELWRKWCEETDQSPIFASDRHYLLYDITIEALKSGGA